MAKFTVGKNTFCRNKKYNWPFTQLLIILRIITWYHHLRMHAKFGKSNTDCRKSGNYLGWLTFGIENVSWNCFSIPFWPKMEFLSSRSWRCIGNVLSTGRVQPKLGREVDYTKIWNIPWEVKVLHKTRWNHWQQFPLDLFWFFYFLYFYIWRSIGNMLPTGRVQSKLEYNDSL